jgi:hypothetical protein
VSYTRKTSDEWEVQGLYTARYGWECVCVEDNRRDALIRLSEYRVNQPQYPHRLRKRRVRIATEESNHGE